MSYSLRDDLVVAEFQDESTALLATIENDVISLEKNPEAINGIFRAIHSVKGSAGILEFVNVSKLAHNLETILDKIRSNSLQSSSEVVDLLLEGIDCLKVLFKNISGSDEVDVSIMLSKLDKFMADQLDPDLSEKIDIPVSIDPVRPNPKPAGVPKRVLIVEDELVNRKLLEEAVSCLLENVQIVSVDSAAKGLYHFFTNSFDLVFLDIMMPRVDGTAFIAVVEENLKEGLIRHKPNIVVQTAIQSIDQLLVLAQNECVQEILRKPIKMDRVQECIYRYC
nr:Hpt domain-containing protein [Desulfobulbaceae bacterium]